MPYITKEDREITKLTGTGKLNYELTSLINEYLYIKGLSYQTINDIIGALEGAKLEFHRRIAIPYENSKLAENGDVYTIGVKKDD